MWQSGVIACIEDVAADENFPHALTARRTGLKAAIGIPVPVTDCPFGVLELFRGKKKEMDHHLMQYLSSLGSQIGQFAERKQGEVDLRQAKVEAINDILDISKIEAGHMEQNLTEFDLAEMISSLATLFRARCEEKNLRFLLHAPGTGSTPCWETRRN